MNTQPVSRAATRRPALGLRAARHTASPHVYLPEASGSPSQRLRRDLPDAINGWVLTVTITVCAFLTRLVKLAYPHDVVFDETFYAKNAYDLLQVGFERNWPDDANAHILAGNPHVANADAAFVVHPPVGKWLIALGEWMFGMTPFGWRIVPAIFGALLVFMVIRLARRISGSNLIGALAGVLLAVDGLTFVMSRVALLDIFQAFFGIAAVAALVADRDWARATLADYLDREKIADLGGAFGPVLWWRPWRLVAGIMFGLAIGTKWGGLYLLAGFALLSLAWDIGMRRVAGSTIHGAVRYLRDGIVAFGQTVVIAAFVYLATWTGWIATSGGWSRNWAQDFPKDNPLPWLPNWAASLIHYHQEMYGFHTGDHINHQTHPYQSHPIGWLLVSRPVGMEARTTIAPGTEGCPASGADCYSIITGLGTPLLWWGATLALIAAVIWWVAKRDWRYGIPVVGVATTWLPWFNYAERPIFSFYAVCIIPFLVVGLALVLGRIIGPATDRHRRIGAILVAFYVALVIANFAYFYPIYTGEVITNPQWQARMWFKSWI